MICVINSSRFDRVIIPYRLVGDAGRGNDEAATEVQTIICSVTKLCDDCTIYNLSVLLPSHVSCIVFVGTVLLLLLLLLLPLPFILLCRISRARHQSDSRSDVVSIDTITINSLVVLNVHDIICCREH